MDKKVLKQVRQAAKQRAKDLFPVGSAFKTPQKARAIYEYAFEQGVKLILDSLEYKFSQMAKKKDTNVA